MDDIHLISVHPKAPAKPALGQDCNGCGICCAHAPCPLSAALLRHRQGACPALSWADGEERYFCGMVRQPSRFVRWLPASFDALFGRMCRRWIAAGKGCDFAAEVLPDA